jgi:CubicO group peptidase (beta-lactamase class C family)
MRIVASILLLSLGVQSALAAPPDPRLVASRIEDTLREQGVISASVAVGNADTILWARSFGPANLEKNRHSDIRTSYSLASVTKPITATAIMRLVDEGKIDLDRPINDYLGAAKLVAFTGDARDATVRRVLDHTAGLPWHVDYFLATGTSRRPSMEETIARSGKIMMPPGETHRYSNLGYGLLEYVIERVSGQSYADYVREHIFAPLGLRDSFVATNPNLPANSATRYTAERRPIAFYDVDHRGASSVFMSASDLVRFGQAHLAARQGRSKLLSAASAREMERRQNELLPASDYYALGWAVVDMNDHHTIGHGGSMPGAAAQLLIATETNQVFAVLINRDSYPARRDILAELIRAWAPQLVADAVPTIPPSLVGHWSGHVALDDGHRLPLSLDLSTGELTGTLADRSIHLSRFQMVEDGFSDMTSIDGEIPTAEARRHPHSLRFHLKARGPVVNGYVTALARPSTDGSGSALSYWVELSRR